MTRAEWSRRKGRSSSRIRKSLRFAVFARDNFDCVYCRQVFPPPLDGRGLTLDHVVPRCKGGSDRADNLVTACVRCNSARQAKSVNDPLWGCGSDVRKARVRRQLRKPINRELGRWLAGMAKRLPVPRVETRPYFTDHPEP